MTTMRLCGSSETASGARHQVAFPNMTVGNDEAVKAMIRVVLEAVLKLGYLPYSLVYADTGYSHYYPDAVQQLVHARVLLPSDTADSFTLNRALREFQVERSGDVIFSAVFKPLWSSRGILIPGG